MIKRITLLRKRDDQSTAGFRDHWAKPHAAIATGFEGLRRYNQNRVESVYWQIGQPAFQIDGIVELWFASQAAVDRNAVSETTKALIADEPRFLSGLTALSAGEAGICEAVFPATKYMVLGCAADPQALQRTLANCIASQEQDPAPVAFDMDVLRLAFTRKTLMSEPNPPNFAVTLWLADEERAKALLIAENSPLREAFCAHATAAMAYRIDQLTIA